MTREEAQKRVAAVCAAAVDTLGPDAKIFIAVQYQGVAGYHIGAATNILDATTMVDIVAQAVGEAAGALLEGKFHPPGTSH